ncbi:hypothetical protein HQ520_18800 [bacterium]|nr:hypothetical protein [bacterium]
MQKAFALVLLFAVLGLCGCLSKRTTTTERTAVEQALLSQAAEQTLAGFNFEALAGKSFYLVEDDVDGYDTEYILTSLKHRLLQFDLVEAAQEPDADVLLYPRLANAAIDDSDASLGIPELPLIIPGAGGLTIPELSLYKKETQRGRNRMGVYGVDRETGTLVFETPLVSKETYYKRWVLLFIFSFRTTNLEKPF